MENQALGGRYHNVMSYAKLFFRRKWLIITPTFFGLVAGIVACFLLPRTWESATIMMVEEEKVINPLIQGLAVSTTAVQRVQNIREQILGWNSLVELTKKLDLAKNIQNQWQFEQLVLGLRKSINVNMYGPSIIRISYQGKNPEETQVVAKTISDVFIQQNMESQTKDTDVAVSFIKEQLKVYKRKIKEAEIAKIDEQLKTLLLDSTELHPMVKDLRQKISQLKKELDSDEYKVNIPMEETEKPITSPTVEAIRSEIEKITGSKAGGSIQAGAIGLSESDDPSSNVYKLLMMDKLDSVLARDINVNENIYNMLLQKLETAKITQRLEVSKEGTRYTILDPPRLPLRPVKPNKVQVIFMALFMGAGTGTGLVFLKEFTDQSILDIDDAKHSLELPVLGAISRITTQEEIEKEKQKKAIWMTTAAIIGAIAIISTGLIYLFKK